MSGVALDAGGRWWRCALGGMLPDEGYKALSPLITAGGALVAVSSKKILEDDAVVATVDAVPPNDAVGVAHILGEVLETGVMEFMTTHLGVCRCAGYLRPWKMLRRCQTYIAAALGSFMH